MTRPYTATEVNDSKLARPEWTDIRGDYVWANSSTWPDQRSAVASSINIGNATWQASLRCVRLLSCVCLLQTPAAAAALSGSTTAIIAADGAMA